MFVRTGADFDPRQLTLEEEASVFPAIEQMFEIPRRQKGERSKVAHLTQSVRRDTRASETQGRRADGVWPGSHLQQRGEEKWRGLEGDFAVS